MPEIWRPIINSRLDTDCYKLTMGQFVYHRYPHVPVTYGFKNRTKEIKIADFVDEEDLRRELDWLRALKFQDEELDYLEQLCFENGTCMFQDDYLDFLTTQKNFLPTSLVKNTGTTRLRSPESGVKRYTGNLPRLQSSPNLRIER